MNAAASPEKPLAGVLVVSLDQAVAAPLAAARLAEAGARVIKIERPEGDFARGYDEAANGVSSYFAWLNQGKESIALDLKAPDDRALLDRMLARADVFIQNLAFGAAGRLGLGAATLRQRWPRLICCDVAGFGSGGPYEARKAYDLLIQAESGLISVSGGPGDLGRVGASVADIGAGLNAFGAISAALVRQGRSGIGAHIEVSLFATLAEWLTPPLLHNDYLGVATPRSGLTHPSIAPYGAFAAADGSLLLISIQSDREWRSLAAEVMARPELADAPEFATNAARVAGRAATDAAVADAFATLDAAALRDRLNAARIAFGEINDLAGLSAHPHLRRREAAHELGRVSLPDSAPLADWTGPDQVLRRIPSLNEHGDAIRAEFAV